MPEWLENAEATITRKVGPLPVWAWGAIGVGVVGGGIWLYRSQSGGSNAAGQPTDVTGNPPDPGLPPIGGGVTAAPPPIGRNVNPPNGGTPPAPAPAPANPPPQQPGPVAPPNGTPVYGPQGSYGVGPQQSFGPPGSPYVAPNTPGFVPAAPTGLSARPGNGAAPAPSGTTVGTDEFGMPVVYVGPPAGSGGTAAPALNRTPLPSSAPGGNGGGGIDTGGRGQPA